MNKIRTGIFLAVSVVIIGTVFLYTVYLQNSVKNGYIFADIDSSIQINNTKVNLISKHKNTEKAIGWYKNSIVFNYISNDSSKSAACLYNPKTEQKSILSEIKDHAEIVPLVSKDGNSLVLHKKHNDAMQMIKHKQLNPKNKEYGYFYDIKNEPKCIAEIYNENLNTFEKIFDYQSKVKLLYTKNNDYIMNTVMDVSVSPKGQYVVYCIEDTRGTFDFYVYHVEAKTTDTYTISGYENDFDVISEVSIADNGTEILFKGEKYAQNEKPAAIYKLDFLKEKLKPELVVLCGNIYQLSQDNRYLLYLTGNDDNELTCLDRKTMKTSKIETIIGDFDISNSLNKVAYLVKSSAGAELYVCNFTSNKLEKTLIHKFDQLDYDECIKWNTADSLLVSYNFFNKSYNVRTYIIDLPNNLQMEEK